MGPADDAIVILALAHQVPLTRDATIRAGLITDVLIPLFGSGVSAAEPTLGNLPKLAKPVPQSVKNALGDAVLTASVGRPFEKRAIRVLEEVGYKPKARGFLGLQKSVDTVA